MSSIKQRRIVKEPGKSMDDIPVPYYDAQGELAGSVVIEAAPLGGRVRRRLMFDAVIRHEANQRSGCHKVKTRSEVAGNHAKLFRQKGTGNARAGTRQAPHRKGGGVSMGPVPRSYRQAMNKKARRLAKRNALLTKFADAEAAVIESFQFDEPSTRRMAGLLDRVGSADSCLVLVSADEVSRAGVLSSRNLKRIGYMPLVQASAYDVLYHRRILLTKSALDELMGAEVSVVKES